MTKVADVCARSLVAYNVCRFRLRCGGLLAFVLLAALEARGALTVLVGEPFGSFGTMMPLGHTALYLDRVCADGPAQGADVPPG